MLAYILRSLMQGLVVMLAVAFIAFSMFRFVGDPVVNMLGQEATLQDRAELTERLGLNDPVPLQFARFDAFDKTSATDWVAAAVDRFGRIDGLVNNAGSAEQVSLMDDDEEALDRLWTVNVKAPLRLTRLCLPHLEATGAGRIVNVASLSGKRVRNGSVGYNMTKFALMGLTHTTRHVAWDRGVRATAVCPSFVRTDMSSHTKKLAPDEMIQPGTMAELVRTLIELPNSAAIAELLVNCRLEDML